LHSLDTFAAIEKLVEFYVEQYNTVVPHAAFAGQTPDEMYFGRDEQVTADLATAHARARDARMKTNRELSCQACQAILALPPAVFDSSAASGVLQVQPRLSQMS
jgi:hypothetical protein